MELIHLNKIDNSNIKIANSIKQFNSLIKLLNDKNLTLNVIKKINDDIVGSPFSVRIKSSNFC